MSAAQLVEMTAYTALAIGAIVAAIAYVKVLTERERPASRRKTGAVTPQDAPTEPQATAEPHDIGLLRRLLALEAQLEQINTRLADLKESTDRRFGRLNQARSREAAAASPGGEEEDDETLPLFPPQAARPRVAQPNGARPRALIPRR